MEKTVHIVLLTVAGAVDVHLSESETDRFLAEYAHFSGLHETRTRFHWKEEQSEHFLRLDSIIKVDIYRDEVVTPQDNYLH